MLKFVDDTAPNGAVPSRKEEKVCLWHKEDEQKQNKNRVHGIDISIFRLLLFLISETQLLCFAMTRRREEPCHRRAQEGQIRIKQFGLLLPDCFFFECLSCVQTVFYT